MIRTLSSLLNNGTPEHLPSERSWLKPVNVVLKVLSSFPPHARALVRERLQATGKLDFKNSEILMDLSSRAEVKRLWSCKKEPDTIAWLEKHLRPDDVFFDVGANVGAYSFVAQAIVSRRCRVFAFEPSFPTFSSLCRNIRLNGLSPIICPLQVALTDRDGMLEFQYSDLAPGAALHSTEHDTPSAEAIYRQPTLGLQLDTLVATFGLPPASLMKIDVDGGEERVLRGARRVLSSVAMRSVLIEIVESSSSARNICSLMEELGFKLAARHPRGSGKWAAANYVFERM